jgi:hypothetical protein
LEDDMPASPVAEDPHKDDAIRAVVVRLSRPRASGGNVIERAAILAEGAHAAAIVQWITDHAGQPESAAPVAGRGLHGSCLHDRGSAQRETPVRYVLPAGLLSSAASDRVDVGSDDVTSGAAQ